MNDIQYIGEQLWIGQLGHFLALLAFVCALFCVFSYFQFRRDNNSSWRSMARTGFWMHCLSVFGIIGLILYAMTQHMYEYDYVFRTVSDDSPMRYLLAAFWADQEGSFLLWMFWHCVLGLIFIYKTPKWEAPTILILALIQVFLTSMLLGIYIPGSEEDIKIGSNPFILIRDVFDAPIFDNADYLVLVEGRGLNPLLQNYWMTIHPPVLFLGFASLSIPYCMSMAGLATGRHKELLLPLMQWSLFAAAIFGLGILMGAAWAYEALTFGGYWAWDPVENTSLVPWLVLLAGVHTNMIARATSRSIRTTYGYYLLAFIMVVYSTFLTRSGILGDTSVHAFTTMGLETQLVLFIVFFGLLAIWQIIKGGKSVPKKEKEEELYSREFWMFIGALVLFFSGLLMTASTSLPVYNKIYELFDPNHIPIAIDDPMAHHNQYQIWIGIFIGMLSGLTILLRYHGASWGAYKSTFFKRLGATLLITGILSFFICDTIKMTTWQHDVFLFAGLLAIIGNAGYILSTIRGNWKLSGAALSHMGFGLLVLGIMYSGLNKKTITSSPFVQEDFVIGQGVDKALVLIKDLPFYSQEYWMNYVGDTLVGNLRKYELEFKKVDKDQKVVDAFTTFPSALYNKEFTKIAALNPGNQRKLFYDVFTAAAPNEHQQDIEIAKMMEDSLHYLSHYISPGDTIVDSIWTIQVGEFVFNHEFEATSENHRGDTSDYNLTVGLPMRVKNLKTGREFDVTPGLGLKDAFVYQFPVVIDELGMKIKLADEVFGKVFSKEEDLSYTDIQLRQNESYEGDGYHVSLISFSRGGTYDSYKPEEGDIALAAQLEVTSNGRSNRVQPLFILRGSQQFSIKDYDANSGLHIRFTRIDPQSEVMTFSIAQDDRADKEIELNIADEVPRSDILIVEANIFPGINLVWLGCLMMLGGLTLSWLVKRKHKT